VGYRVGVAEVARDHTTLKGREPSRCLIPTPFDEQDPPHPLNLPTFDDFWSSSGPKPPNVGDRRGCDEFQAWIHVLNRGRRTTPLGVRAATPPPTRSSPPSLPTP